jgi:hypothetical protein
MSSIPAGRGSERRRPAVAVVSRLRGASRRSLALLSRPGGDDLLQRPEVANRIESFLRSETETSSASRAMRVLLAMLPQVPCRLSRI